MCCLQSDGKSGIHLQMKSDMLSWEKLSSSKPGMLAVKSTKKVSEMFRCWTMKWRAVLTCIVLQTCWLCDKLQSVWEWVNNRFEVGQ